MTWFWMALALGALAGWWMQWRENRREVKRLNTEVQWWVDYAKASDERTEGALDFSQKVIDAAQQVNDGVARHKASARADEAVAFHASVLRRR